MENTGVVVPVLAVLLVTTLLPAPSLAAGDLVADAGESRVAIEGREVAVQARAFGGTAPYTFAWSYQGSDQRFEDPSASETTFQVPDGTGEVELELTVTDADGSTATDTVLYPVASVLLEVEAEIEGGVPDELIGASGRADGETRQHPFQVPAGSTGLVATLSWTNAVAAPFFGNDLDLELRDPDGETPADGAGKTAGHPERIVLSDPTPGTWTAQVEPWLSGPETYTLAITGGDVPELHRARIVGSTLFGTEDTQTLEAAISGPFDPAQDEAGWDLDLDGVYEVSGLEATSDFGPGEHTVAFKATNLTTGYESRVTAVVEVDPEAEFTLSLRCAPNPSADVHTMEWQLSGKTCWMHGGHHTYFLNDVYELVGGEGFVFSVEQQFSPPTEYEDPPFTTPVVIQTSLDGLSWTDVDAASYRFLDDPSQGISFPATRQGAEVTVAASEEPFRFVRIHQPRSAAQGLSGFLDASRFDLRVAQTDAPIVVPSPPPGEVHLSCLEGDLMEDFFESHPCTFGGINRYDAPSFFHTYPLGGIPTVEGVDATFQVLPWRTDDWFLPLVPPVEQVTNTTVFLETSVDGMTWSRHGGAEVLFGEPGTLSVAFEEPEPARFVRLVPDLHPLFEDFRDVPPLHHPEAFFTFSELTVTPGNT